MATVGTTPRPAYVYDANTDTWIPVGVGPHSHANFVEATVVDAKGDLLVASADNTVTKLTVGANDFVLTADSGATNGVKWAAASGGGASIGLESVFLLMGA